MIESFSADVIVFAPTGKDTDLIASSLREKNISVVGVKNEAELYSRLRSDCGLLVIAEEALKDSAIEILNLIFSEQEPWSDIPIIVMTFGGPATESAVRVQDTFSSQGNVTLLERPFRKATLISTVQVGLRSRKKQYQMRDLLKKQIAATQMREEFISVAGHELKTPLTALKLQTQMNQKILKVGTLSFEKVNRLVEVTDRQTNRLVRLVEDMLDMSRVSTGKLTMNKQPADLSKIVEEVVETMRLSFAEAHCDLTCEVESNIKIYADHYRIEQVITNLLTNALRYAPKKPVKVKCLHVDNLAKIEVSDQGPGIPKDAQARIFERFERAVSSRNISGLGIGLYICKEIVDAHEGKIYVSSEPDHGATFTAVLPLL